jgi:hypothetical protein
MTDRTHQYDAFLSYNGDDIDFVRGLAEQLDTRFGIVTFFAELDLLGGTQWQPELEQALKRSRTCVVCVGSSSLGPWQSKEVRAAIQEQVETESIRVIPVLIPGADKSVFKDLPAFLKQSHGFTFSSPGDQETLERLAASILGKQRAVPLLWYFDDSPKMLAEFKQCHGSRFAIKTYENAVDFVEALMHVRPGSASFPDAVLVDMHVLRQGVSEERLAETNARLEQFFRLERELRGWVDRAWRPYGADVVEAARRLYPSTSLPIAIYTQRGLVLLDDAVTARLERMGVEWVLKERFSAETERLMFNNIIAGCRDAIPSRPRILYVDDSDKFRHDFAERHSGAYELEIISDQGEVVPILRKEFGTGDWPALLLVDLYYPRDTSAAGMAAIHEANVKLAEFNAFESGLRAMVMECYEPIGLSIVQQIREQYDSEVLPVIIYTQTGLLLLDEESIRQMELLRAGWLLKERYSVETEAMKILAVLRKHRHD